MSSQLTPDELLAQLHELTHGNTSASGDTPKSTVSTYGSSNLGDLSSSPAPSMSSTTSSELGFMDFAPPTTNGNGNHTNGLNHASNMNGTNSHHDTPQRSVLPSTTQPSLPDWATAFFTPSTTAASTTTSTTQPPQTSSQSTSHSRSPSTKSDRRPSADVTPLSSRENPNPFVNLLSPPPAPSTSATTSHLAPWMIHSRGSSAEHATSSSSAAAASSTVAAGLPISNPIPSTSSSSATAPGVPVKKSRIRTSSFSKLQKEREQAAQAQATAERIRAGSISENRSAGGDESKLTTASIKDTPVTRIVGLKKEKPTPNYAMPTANSTKALTPAAASMTTAQPTTDEKEEEQIKLTRRKKKSSSSSSNKKTPEWNVPIVATNLLSTRPPKVIASYVELLPLTPADLISIPLTIKQAQTCIVHVIRMLQSNTVDATAMEELKQILHKYVTTPIIPPDNSPSSSSTSTAAAAPTSPPSMALFLTSSIASLQADQIALLAAQLNSRSLKLLSQLPRSANVNPIKVQELWRWYQHDLARRSGAGAGSTSSNIDSASLQPQLQPQPQPTPRKRSSAVPSGPSTPSRPPPSIVDISLASPSKSPHPATASSTTTSVESSSVNATTMTLPTSSSLPPPTAAAVGSSSSGLHTPLGDGGSSSGSLTVSQFFSATSGPLHAGAATPITVRPSRYDSLPSRLLDHFRDPASPFSSFYPALYERSRSRSRSQSQSRRSHSAAGTPRRSTSLDRGGSSSVQSTPRLIPNHALRGGSYDDSSLDLSNVTAATVLQATIRRPTRQQPGSARRSSSVASPAIQRWSFRPPSLHVAQFSEISSKLQMKPLSSSLSTRIPVDDSSSPPTSASPNPALVTLPSSSPTAAALLDSDDPDVTATVMAEIETMNQSLERLLAAERERSRERRERGGDARRHRRNRSNGSNASSRSGTSASGLRSRSRTGRDDLLVVGGGGDESHRSRTIRRPAAIFPGTNEIYRDDPETLSKIEARHVEGGVYDPPIGPNGEVLSTTLTGRSDEPPHIFSPPRNAVLPPNPHSYQGVKYQHSGHRSAGYPHQPKARFMSFLDYEANLKHAREAISWKATLEGRQSAHRKYLQSPPEHVLKEKEERARSLTPSKSPRHVRRLECVPQARHMGYLTPEANSELFRQTSTYATIIAGGSVGGSSQPPLNAVLSKKPLIPDRSIRERSPLPQARGMGYLSPEVNAAHIKEARTWSKKIEGTYEAPRLTASTFRYRVEDDPFFRHHHGAPMVAQARPMGFLAPEVNAAHFKLAQLQGARVKGSTTTARPIPSPRARERLPAADETENEDYETTRSAAAVSAVGQRNAKSAMSPSLAKTPLRSTFIPRHDEEDESSDPARTLFQTHSRENSGASGTDRSSTSEDSPLHASDLLATPEPPVLNESEEAERYYTALRAQQARVKGDYHSAVEEDGSEAPSSSYYPSATTSSYPSASSSSIAYDPFAAEQATISKSQPSSMKASATSSSSSTATTTKLAAMKNAKQLRPSNRQQII